MSTASRSGATPVEGVTDGLSQDVAFEMLSCRRRRNVLHYLFQVERPVELRELSTQLAAWENDVEAAEVTYEQRMRVYTALRQLHLPRMDEEGVIRFEQNRGVATLTEEASELEVYLDIVPHDEIPWSSYYLGLSALCGAAVAAAFVGAFPLSVLPGLAWAGVVAALFAGSALAHWNHDRKYRLGSEGEPPV